MESARTVLYAEDDENDAFFMERAFASLARADQLKVVTSGKQAIDVLSRAEIAGSGSPLLVILDIKMPEMSGMEVLAWIRSQPQFCTLPVVMFTSSTQEKDVELSRQQGANAYVVKPSNAEHLAKLVDRLLAAATAVPAERFNLPENQL